MTMWTLLGHEVRIARAAGAALVGALLGPLLLTALTVAAFGDLDTPDIVKIAVVDHDRGAVAKTLFRRFQVEPHLKAVADLTAYASEAQARQAVTSGRAEAALVLPEGLTTATLSGGSSVVTVVQSDAKPIAGGVAAAVAEGLSTEVRSRQITVRTISSLVAAGSRSAKPAALGPGLDVVDVGTSRARLKGASYFGPAMSILFMFFTVTFGARRILTARRTQVALRMRVLGTHDYQLVASTLLANAAQSLLGFLIAWAASVLVFHATWGPAPAVLVLTFSVVLAASGLSVLLTALVATETQLESLAAAVVFMLVVLGGLFLPPYELSGPLSTASGWTPTGQGLSGFLTSLTTGDSSQALPACTRMIGFAVLAGGLGLALLERKRA